MIDEMKSYALKSWELTEDLHAYHVLAEQEIAFRETGFVRVESRRCMMRPTEQLETSMDLNYMHRIPTIDNKSKIVEVFREAYANGPDEREAQVYAEDAERYFDVVDPKLLVASSVVHDRITGEIVGVCLISLWEGLPLVYSIAVLPQHRGMGLATAMLNRALTVLEPDYPVLRLFVTTGNQASDCIEERLSPAGNIIILDTPSSKM